MKTIYLTDKEYKLLIYTLEEYHNAKSGQVCDDLCEPLLSLFTKDEGKQIEREFAVFNNPNEPEGPPWPLQEGCLVYWLKRKIEQYND